MNLEDRDRWESVSLDATLEALAASQELCSTLIYKGARILNRRLDTYERLSLDIDTNLADKVVAGRRTPQETGEFLQQEFSQALNRYFESQEPIRYKLQTVNVAPSPDQQHTHGWDGFRVTIRVHDFTKEGVRGLPGLIVDVAAPEELLAGSTAPLPVGPYEVNAYTTVRLAGEKMRAFLSSLPNYRRKMEKPIHAVRVKDIFDLALVCRYHPSSDPNFWMRVAEEFRTACSSRYVDCEGIATFEEELHNTRTAYEKDATIPKLIPFDRAWDRIRKVVALMVNNEVMPFAFPYEP